ncbi:hypothetical protein KPL78_00955 [Roseomonas sp. HJA6]|uniref:Nucleotidyltransferase family protein n=2 Tax=Roseomonas alba TaxID=2846776 RepID=A0ABS7A271_9PROT|nr:hypothetical protein [Neoroseomonas alba]
MAQVVTQFGTTPHRRSLLQGLLNYRQALRSLAITQGSQWIGGSFLEDCEHQRGRPPQDIDVLTLIEPPSAFLTPDAWAAHIASNAPAFQALTTPASKATYGCDAYFMELYAPPMMVVASTHYWFGLFSHSRKMEWKGLVEVPLGASNADDDAALAELARMNGS